MNLFPPNVTANDVTLQIGDSVSLASLFVATDLDGDELTAYRFRDNNASTVSGFFTVNGVIQPPNVLIEIDASQINSVRYNAGLIEGNETFSIQANDGQFLSNVATAQAATVQANFFAPVITPIPSQVLESERIDAADLFSVSDAENNEILSYFVVDRLANSNGGFFLLDGVRQNSGQFFRIDADQLDDLQYVGGAFGQTENVAFQAFDGEFFSDITDVAVTTIANQFRPITTAFNVNSPLGRVIAGETLFSFFDQDGNTLSSVGFQDTGTAADSGFFTVNGVRQDAGTFFFVQASEIDSVRYNVSESSDSEIIRIITTDGRFTSAAASATVNAIPRPELDVPDREVILNGLELVDFVDLVSQADDGPSLTQFQVIDQDLTGNPNAASLVLNGDQLERGVLHTLTPQEFASLDVQGGFADFRSQNSFLVRGRNELFFTDFEEFRVNTEVNFDEAVSAGFQFGPESDNGDQFVITYTFGDGGDPVPSYFAADSDFRDGATPLNGAMRNAIRDVFDLFESYADLEFVEVPFTQDAEDASIVFGLTEGINAPGATLLGANGAPGLGDQFGDIWFNRDIFPETGVATAPGSQFFFTALGQVARALGLEAPLEGDVSVPQSLNFSVFSVLATQNVGGLLLPSTLGIYDIAELQDLYRTNEEFNLGNTQYFFNNSQSPVTLFDSGGRDTINLTNTIVQQSVDLHQGAFSTINGNPVALTIAFGAQIENARGGGAADTLIGNSVRNLLFGNEGADILEGNGGNDVLRGGSGRDTYIWRTGDGRDRIDEQRAGGVDTLDLFDDTALSSLSDDLVFRRFGRDLRIDLRFNRGQAQGSIIIEDQQFGGSRVETLRFFNSSGEQIGVDIDLDSIFQQATTTAQFFELTTQESNRGFIAVPT